MALVIIKRHNVAFDNVVFDNGRERDVSVGGDQLRLLIGSDAIAACYDGSFVAKATAGSNGTKVHMWQQQPGLKQKVWAKQKVYAYFGT